MSLLVVKEYKNSTPYVSILNTEDGTTAPIKEFGRGFVGSTEFVKMGQRVFFTADDDLKGMELWVTDGTSGGTVMVKDIAPGLRSSNPMNLKVSGDKLYFTATNLDFGRELWVTDGTAAGTHIVADLNVGSSDTSIYNMTPTAGGLLFSSGFNGPLIFTNGETTEKISDISSSYISASVGGAAFFISGTDNNLWETDGTASGTHLLHNLRQEFGIYRVEDISQTSLGVFVRTEHVEGQEQLWFQSASTKRMVLLAEFPPSYMTAAPKIVNDTYFFMTGGMLNETLWVTDGTVSGTTKIVSGIMSANIIFSDNNYSLIRYKIDREPEVASTYDFKLGKLNKIDFSGGYLASKNSNGYVTIQSYIQDNINKYSLNYYDLNNNLIKTILGTGNIDFNGFNAGSVNFNISFDGTAGSDSLFGGIGDDTISGFGGDDEINGGKGDDTLNGNDGNDFLGGGEGADILNGGAGNDGIAGGDGNDSLDGGDGDDTLLGQAGDDTISGGLGADFIDAGDGIDTVNAGDANDLINGGNGNDIINGDAGNDSIYGDAGNDVIDGGAGDDDLSGGNDNDTITGGVGDDRIAGGYGDDILNGGDGNDTISANDGNDTITGGIGVDNLYGFTGNDTIDGGDGNDTLLGMEGDDTVTGGAGADYIVGGDGIDTLYGDDGDDNMQGNDGADTLSGGLGNDGLDGGAGNDTLNGDAGNDYLGGGEGNDILNGGDGNDVFVGGAGKDTLTGGSGADAFFFTALTDSSSVAIDKIIDFSLADGDYINLSQIDANTTTAGDQAFSFVNSFTKQAGQATLTYDAASNTSTFSADVDGDGVADFVLQINGQQDTSNGWVL